MSYLVGETGFESRLDKSQTNNNPENIRDTSRQSTTQQSQQQVVTKIATSNIDDIPRHSTTVEKYVQTIDLPEYQQNVFFADTPKQPVSPKISQQLACVISSWEKLSPTIREAIMLLIKSQNENT